MTVDNTRNSGELAGRNPDGTFARGNPGRPRGTRTRATLAAEALLDGEAEALTRKAVDLALAGDTTALRLRLERIAPPRKDSPVTFSMPDMATAADASAALAGIVHAVADGELTPTEAATVAGLFEAFRRNLLTEEIERRLAILEARK